MNALSLMFINLNQANLRAMNKLSGQVCNYCSIRCMRIDRNNFLGHKESFNTSTKSIKSQSSSLSICPSVKASTSRPHREISKPKNSSKKISSIWKGFKVPGKSAAKPNKAGTNLSKSIEELHKDSNKVPPNIM